MRWSMNGQKISIAELRPTQMTLGLDEVASRAAKIAKMGPDDLKALLKKKPIPYVRGPGKQIYIVDHHHLARRALVPENSGGGPWPATRRLVR